MIYCSLHTLVVLALLLGMPDSVSMCDVTSVRVPMLITQVLHFPPTGAAGATWWIRSKAKQTKASQIISVCCSDTLGELMRI